MIVSFQDDETCVGTRGALSHVPSHTSDLRFIKQGAALDLNRLTQLATLHYEVTHDLIGVQEASVELSNLMRAPPLYSKWRTVLIGGLASVCIAPISFNASFIDLLVSWALGSILVIIQIWVASKSDILSALFEIVRAGAATELTEQLVVTIVSLCVRRSQGAGDIAASAPPSARPASSATRPSPRRPSCSCCQAGRSAWPRWSCSRARSCVAQVRPALAWPYCADGA